ncbi:MAG: hypothetical protein RLY93_07370 [Sumerlaeia bacterium]
MFKNLSIEQKLLLLNIVLFGFIGAAGYILMTEERLVPEEPDVDGYIAVLQEEIANLPEDRQSGSTYINIGKKDLFRTLIELPTPTPTPTPTPQPTPSLDEALQYWKLEGVFGDTAVVTDKRTRETWMMSMSDDSRVKTVQHRGENVDVRLIEIDDQEKFSATWAYTNPRGTQKKTMSMLDPE